MTFRKGILTMRNIIWLIVGLLVPVYAGAQLLHDAKDLQFTRKDSLRGGLTPLRTAYDIVYYHLDVRIDPAERYLSGSNKIRFRVVEDLLRIQIDLFENMKIERIALDDKTALAFKREFDAVFVDFPRKLTKHQVREITVYYSGSPIVARRPPWEGGFVWSKDKEGNPWVAVTCQGTGASLWWPTKEHQSDEPDSMLLSVTVPPGLMNISNGRLRKTQTLADGWTRSDWFISYPINNYNVTVNIGRYAHFSDLYMSGSDMLTLDYYVLPENLEKAKRQFQQIKPMLACFERYFGPYPFIRDGFKQIESPHLGMEHQSALAYGNNYLQGYRGTSSSEVGVKFDFILIHEAAHEWWGNSVTSKDIGDMWIHESFGAYAEALYVECLYGYEEAIKYVNGKKGNIGNQQPIIGVYGVNKEGSRDMYDKGQLVLNTLRHVIGNDALWFRIVRGLAEEFKYHTVTAEDVFGYISRKSSMDLKYFFDQYFKTSAIPLLEISLVKRGERVTMRYRWQAGRADFRMPVRVTMARGKLETLVPTTEWKNVVLEDMHPDEFRVAEEQFYINVRITKRYVDPAAMEFTR